MKKNTSEGLTNENGSGIFVLWSTERDSEPITLTPNLIIMYIQINIGRNIKDRPMTNGQWATFRAYCDDAVPASVAKTMDVDAVHALDYFKRLAAVTGHDSVHGEDACMLAYQVADKAVNVPFLEQWLADGAKQWEQWGIALTVIPDSQNRIIGPAD